MQIEGGRNGLVRLGSLCGLIIEACTTLGFSLTSRWAFTVAGWVAAAVPVASVAGLAGVVYLLSGLADDN